MVMIMPGLDRRGPMGRGPKTGRGLGRCGPGRTGRDYIEELEEKKKEIEELIEDAKAEVKKKDQGQS
ncbi:MAG: DUF5320 domain-containing protein [Nanobdellota archaeon]